MVLNLAETGVNFIRKKMAARKNIEDQLQIACIRYMRAQYPNVLCFHVRNEGIRGTKAQQMAYGAKSKRMGVLAGVSDIIIMSANGGFHGACIELKAPKGTVTDSQGKFLDKVEVEGYYRNVCWSFDEFKEYVDFYLTKPRTVTRW